MHCKKTKQALPFETIFSPSLCVSLTLCPSPSTPPLPAPPPPFFPFLLISPLFHPLPLPSSLLLTPHPSSSAIIEHTKKVVYLEDDDIAAVAEGKLSLHRGRGVAGDYPPRAIQTLQMELQEIMKGQGSGGRPSCLSAERHAFNGRYRLRVEFSRQEINDPYQ